MIELLICAIFFALMALSLVFRIAKGPTPADRMVAGDACDNLLCCAMILFSMYTGRGIYLNIALVGAFLGIIDTMLVGRYLEGSL
ncbi:MAG: cation:proton antiporter [Oscillospiraceae bacterium]|jgi:multisubunit Na+/H+ antiporter MnhF subunit|nr:cation:proton antiporter [Oscillospiraceae bacterium]